MIGGVRPWTCLRGTKGTTLIEIMVTLVILSIVMTAVFSTFLSQQQSYTVQNAAAEVQQNVRGGMQFMERDIRNAGSGLAGLPSTVAVTLPAAMTGSGAVTMNYGLGVLDGGANGADNVYVIFVIPDATTLAATMAGVTSPLNVVNATGWTVGDMGIVFNSTNADVFQVAAVTDTNLTHILFGNANLSIAYAAGDTVGRIYYAGYFIDNTTNSVRPTLSQRSVGGVGTLTSQVVADDIEDLQARLILDNTSEGDRNDAIITGNLARIRQVRVYLSGRTAGRDKSWSEPGGAD